MKASAALAAVKTYAAFFLPGLILAGSIFHPWSEKATGIVVMSFVVGVLAALMVYAIHRIERIGELLTDILEGQRLSTILEIGPTSLRVKPEDFEPNRARLKARVAKTMTEKSHPNPETLAYCILEGTGLPLFLELEARNKLQKALGRLLANGDREKAELLLEDVIEQL